MTRKRHVSGPAARSGDSEIVPRDFVTRVKTSPPCAAILSQHRGAVQIRVAELLAGFVQRVATDPSFAVERMAVSVDCATSTLAGCDFSASSGPVCGVPDFPGSGPPRRRFGFESSSVPGIHITFMSLHPIQCLMRVWEGMQFCNDFFRDQRGIRFGSGRA